MCLIACKSLALPNYQNSKTSLKLQIFPNANIEFFATTETIFFDLKVCNMVMFRNPSNVCQNLAEMNHLLLVLIFLSLSYAMPAAFCILYYRSSLNYFHALEGLSRDCANVIFWTSFDSKMLLYQKI